jgi:hypothetical protein
MCVAIQAVHMPVQDSAAVEVMSARLFTYLGTLILSTNISNEKWIGQQCVGKWLKVNR